MGVKEDGLYTGTGVFAVIGFITAIILGFYVKIRTKDQTQAFDNMK
jgi:hypothetical protein